jgi:hypothetical protein
VEGPVCSSPVLTDTDTYVWQDQKVSVPLTLAKHTYMPVPLVVVTPCEGFTDRTVHGTKAAALVMMTAIITTILDAFKPRTRNQCWRSILLRLSTLLQQTGRGTSADSYPYLFELGLSSLALASGFESHGGVSRRRDSWCGHWDLNFHCV